MAKKPTRQEKAGMAIILGFVGLVAFSCSAITGSDEPGQSTTTTPPPPVETSETPAAPYDPAVGVPLGDDIPDCDKHHKKATITRYIDGPGWRTFCVSDRDGDGIADETDEIPDLNDFEDTDGDGLINSGDDYPEDASRRWEYEEQYKKEVKTYENDTEYSNPFFCGPGDRDGDGDGKCNER